MLAFETGGETQSASVRPGLSLGCMPGVRRAEDLVGPVGPGSGLLLSSLLSPGEIVSRRAGCGP